MTSSVLFYDSSRNTGHHLEFLLHLLDYIIDTKDEAKHYSFLVHPEMAEGLHKYHHYKNIISIDYIEANRIASFERMGFIERGNAEVIYISEYLKNRKIKVVNFLMLDPYQLALAVYKNLFEGIEIQGIFFKPYPRYVINKKSLLQYLSDLIFINYKKILFWLFKRNRAISKIWVLNDFKSAEIFNYITGERKFEFLPDPVKRSLTERGSEFEIISSFKDSTVKKLIIFGSISPLKNLENILNAISGIENTSIHLYILGRWYSNEYLKKIEKVVDSVCKKNNKIKVFIENRYFLEEEVDYYIANADCILIAYYKFFYSSGVLGRAAMQGVPVLGTKNSLNAEYIERYSLGDVVDPYDVDDIRVGIERILSSKHLRLSPGMKVYVDERTPEKFARQIIYSNDKVSLEKE